jgi:hypothetical protein
MPAQRGQVASESMMLPGGGQSRIATVFCVTGNLSFRDLVDRERLHPAIVRRLDDMCTVLEVWGRETKQPRDPAPLPGAILPHQLEGACDPGRNSPGMQTPHQDQGAIGWERKARDRESRDCPVRRRGRRQGVAVESQSNSGLIPSLPAPIRSSRLYYFPDQHAVNFRFVPTRQVLSRIQWAGRNKSHTASKCTPRRLLVCPLPGISDS